MMLDFSGGVFQLVAGVSERIADRGLGAYVLDDLAEERLPRPGCAGELVGLIGKPPQAIHEDGLEQGFLGWEVPKQGADADPAARAI
jgi:hypothetical protein